MLVSAQVAAVLTDIALSGLSLVVATRPVPTGRYLSAMGFTHRHHVRRINKAPEGRHLHK